MNDTTHDLPALSERWLKNKKAIGFTENIIVKNKKIAYTIEKCPDKYKGKLTELLEEIIHLAVASVGELFDFPARESDIENIRIYLDSKMPIYINTLLSSGYQEFLSDVSASAKITQLILNLSSTHEVNGKWVNWKGHRFEAKNGCWIKENGDAYSDSASLALWSVLK